MVAPNADLPAIDRALDGAASSWVWVQSGKAHNGYIRPKLGEEAFHFFRDDVPQLKLPDARRIDDPAAEFETDQLGGRRRVPAFLVHFADRADAQRQFRLNRVQQRRLADAALPRKDRGAILQQLAKPVEALSRPAPRSAGRECRAGSRRRSAIAAAKTRRDRPCSGR